MRYIHIVLSTIILCASAQAQTYSVSPTLDSMTAYCLEQLDIPITGSRNVDTGFVHRKINEGYAATCNDAPAIERIDTVLIWKDNEGGVLPDDFLRAHAVFRMYGGDSSRVPMVLVDPDTLKFMNAPGTQNRDTSLSPGIAYTFAQRLLTTPKVIADSAYPDSYLVMYFAMGDKLDTLTETCEVLPEYLPAVLNYAMARIEEKREKWTAAAWYDSRYEKIVSKPRTSRTAEMKQ